MERAELSIYKRSAYIAALCILIPLSLYSIHRNSISGTMSGIAIVGLAIIVASLGLMKLIPISVYAYFFIFFINLLIAFNYAVFRYNMSVQLLFVFIEVCVLCSFDNGSTVKHGLRISISMLADSVIIWGYESITTWVMPYYYKYSRLLRLDAVYKFAILLGIGLLYIGIVFIIILAVGKIFKLSSDTAHIIASKYTEIEIFSLVLIGGTLVFLSLISVVPWLASDTEPVILAIMIFLIVLQIMYIRLMFKVVSLKEQMKINEDAKRSLLLYNNDLEHSLDDLRTIRHDVKNLFLTMGGFVERSDDAEMKNFYRERIMPFVNDAMKRSDIQISLKNIKDEGLKSFLYYKIIDCSERGVNVKLDIQLLDGGVFIEFVCWVFLLTTPQRNQCIRKRPLRLI